MTQELPEDNQMPSREDIARLIREQLESTGEATPELKVSFDMVEDMLVFGLAGSFMHNLNYVDDPLFIMAANGTLGTHSNGQPLPPEDLINTKIPLTLTGYGLLDGRGDLIGFTCFDSQINKSLTGDPQ
jgi:hypothetical protein